MGIHSKLPRDYPASSNKKNVSEFDHAQNLKPGSRKSSVNSTRSKSGHDATRVENLLVLEAEVRKCTKLRQLQFLIANETMNLISARQIVLVSGEKKPAISVISGLATLDKTSPTLRWLENALVQSSNKDTMPGHKTDRNNSNQTELNYVTTRKLDVSTAPNAEWPYDNSMIAELQLKQTQAKVFFLSDTSFSSADMAMAERLVDTYSHAWNALQRTGFSFSRMITKKATVISLTLIVALMFLPVTMTVLAPAEIVARDPVVVAAPLTGVLDTIEVDPNTYVEKNQLLFSYTATDLQNELEIAKQSVALAESRLLRASQDAFGLGNGRRELAELKLEFDLAQVKYNYADARLMRSKVHAARAGIILFSDRNEWIGKPVSTGEKIMKIAEPSQIEFLIKLAVSDSIILQDGNHVRVFLDADPLNPVTAKIIRRSYHAKNDEMNNLSYELIAQPDIDAPQNDQKPSHRIGVRGTSQIFGNKVPLAMFLFRKPLSAFRQYFGY